jgi:hypothetical protein
MATLGEFAFTTPVTNSGPAAITGLGRILALSLTCVFTATGGGIGVRVYVQSSLDGGNTYFDAVCFTFGNTSGVLRANLDGCAQVAPTAPSAGALADNTCAHGLLGEHLRFVVTSTGTFSAGTKIALYYTTR